MRIRLGIWLILIFCSSILNAQHAFRGGLIPQINVTIPLSTQWKLNAKFENRHLFFQGQFGNVEGSYSFQLNDISLIGAYKTPAKNSLAAGYLIRLVEDRTFHRLIQQYTIIDPHSRLRYGHRIRTDQTFGKEGFISFRLRYRLSVMIALNGLSVDPKEFYFKSNLEILNIFRDNDYDLELRLIPFLGYIFNDNNKMEAGFGYRLDTFIDGDPRSTIWGRISWFASF